MAKKKRQRIWWFALTESEYNAIRASRKLPVPMALFDKQNMAYANGYANRFEPIYDANDMHVTVNDYAQLEDTGRITLMGIKGEYINWKKGVTSERGPEGGGEMIAIHQPIDLHEHVVYQVLAESDEQYLNHLLSPLARAGGILPPKGLVERVEKKRAEAQAAAAKEEAAANGEDEGQEAHVIADEAGQPTA